MTAAVFGLEVDGRQSAIIPFRKKAQLIPMVSGLITLAHNAGYIIDAQVVRQKDAFDYNFGLTPMIHHQPARGQGRGNDNPIVAAYAVSWPKGSREDAVFDVLELPDIIARRDKSAAFKTQGDGSAWTTDFAAMARKSAVRARANHLPWQVQKAEELEGRHERGEITNAVKMPDGSINIDGEVLDGGDDHG
jgi:recombination protein RecT